MNSNQKVGNNGSAEGKEDRAREGRRKDKQWWKPEGKLTNKRPKQKYREIKSAMKREAGVGEILETRSVGGKERKI